MDSFDTSDFHCSEIPRASEPVSYKDFELISQYISGDYTHFARFLGIPHQEIERIEQESNAIKDKITSLYKSIDAKPSYTDRQHLCNALKYIGRNDVVEELKKF
jgi:hypothetical protein